MQKRRASGGWTAVEENQPQAPEVLVLLTQLEESNQQYWAGGWADQPTLLYLELNRVKQTRDEWLRTQQLQISKPDPSTPDGKPAWQAWTRSN